MRFSCGSGIVFREICVLKLKTQKGGVWRSIWEAFRGPSWASGGGKWRFKKPWKKTLIFNGFWGPSWRLHGSFLKALGCLLRALGALLGGSWEALGMFLEASKRHLGPKTVVARIYGR